MLKATAQLSRRRACASVLLALAAGAVIAFFPCAIRSESGSTIGSPSGGVITTTTSRCESLYQHGGFTVLVVFMAPAVVALGATRANRTIQRGIGIAFCVFAVLGSFLLFGFFPMLYAPAGIVLLLEPS